MANNAPVGNCLKDMALIVKFYGTNHFDWKYEFLGILEQHGLKHLIEPAAGGIVVARPNVVKFFFLICTYLYSYYSEFTLKMHSDLLT
jgi:hypothetical protein